MTVGALLGRGLHGIVYYFGMGKSNRTMDKVSNQE
jgi:hypothetical protein